MEKKYDYYISQRGAIRKGSPDPHEWGLNQIGENHYRRSDGSLWEKDELGYAKLVKNKKGEEENEKVL